MNPPMFQCLDIYILNLTQSPSCRDLLTIAVPFANVNALKGYWGEGSDELQTLGHRDIIEADDVTNHPFYVPVPICLWDLWRSAPFVLLTTFKNKHPGECGCAEMRVSVRCGVSG